MKLSDILTVQQLQQLADHIELEKFIRTDYVWVDVLGDFTFHPGAVHHRSSNMGTASSCVTLGQNHAGHQERGGVMAWKIGKCDFCGEPKGDWAACVFRVHRRAPVLLRWVLRRPWMRVWRWQRDDCGSSWTQAEAKKQARHERAAGRRALKGVVCPDCHTTNAHIDLCSWAGSDGLPVLPTVPEPRSCSKATATAGAWGRGELMPQHENTILEDTNHD